MSRILFINSVCNGSTGTICKNLYKAAEAEGHECILAFGRGNSLNGYKTIRIGTKLDVYFHVLKARLFDASGFGSKRATKKFIKEIEKYKPEIIHLHNIHGYYINIEILFKYLKEHPEIKKIWTLHDCWSYTGHCAYYTHVNCDKWKNGCKGMCLNKNEYPKSVLNRVKKNYIKKNMIFNGLSNLKLVTPSEWLKKEVEYSFLKNYSIRVIYNGINTDLFKPTKSDIKRNYNIENKKIILGVASTWDKRKGMDIFLKLSTQIDQDFQIVLIGLSDNLTKILPCNVIGIKRTESVEELVKWYSTAEVFFNASIEETFGMTTIEAICCGTPVLVFDKSALPEVVESNGLIVQYDNLENLYQEIKRACLIIPKTPSLKFSLIEFTSQYLRLYEGE